MNQSLYSVTSHKLRSTESVNNLEQLSNKIGEKNTANNMGYKDNCSGSNALVMTFIIIFMLIGLVFAVCIGFRLFESIEVEKK